jgi:hypothetical protein
MVREALLTSCHVLNRVATNNKDITLLKEWENRKANTLLPTNLGLFGKGEFADQ